eukprot:425147-Pyramimonas_sp.AAC.3
MVAVNRQRDEHALAEVSLKSLKPETLGYAGTGGAAAGAAPLDRHFLWAHLPPAALLGQIRLQACLPPPDCLRYHRYA